MATQIYVAPICPCGEPMNPQLIDVTNFGESTRYCLEWVCISSEEHDAYFAKISKEQNQ